MATLTIEISTEDEKRLREEALRHNASVESFAAKLLADQLRHPLPAEFDVTDDEIAIIHDAIDQVRAGH
jgi:hypothetical protein